MDTAGRRGKWMIGTVTSFGKTALPGPVTCVALLSGTKGEKKKGCGTEVCYICQRREGCSLWWANCGLLFDKWKIYELLLGPFNSLSSLGLPSPGFQVAVFPNRTWKVEISNVRPFACRASAVLLSYNATHTHSMKKDLWWDRSTSTLVDWIETPPPSKAMSFDRLWVKSVPIISFLGKRKRNIF